MGSSSRERAMPLVPEPFKNLCISRQSVVFGNEPMASTWARFCPNLDIPKYREPLSDKKKTELDKRTAKLLRRAIGNQLHKSSEFGWEVCAWHDVFGLIMDDQGLRMDKRPYEYVGTDDREQTAVKTRIPDATLGLKAYDAFELSRRYTCAVPDCEEEHNTKQPDKRLSQERLAAMMHNPECGLIVDGSWGNTDIVFPYAVYEAKKRASSYEAAEDQIYHACKTYLAMLDDLARNPDNVAEYQTKDSSKYQLFAFTSCGPYWEVYVAWNFLDSCHVETIWEGDIKDFSRAFELICIVDQIHDYAVNDHRTFVMKHLEAWHARHEKSLGPEGSLLDRADTLRAAVQGGGTSDGEDSDTSAMSIDIEDIIGLMASDDEKIPEWFRLKQKSKSARVDKAQRTRARNRNLRALARDREVIDADPGPARAKAKATKERRKRGPKRGSNPGSKPGRGRSLKKSNKVVKVAEGSSRGTRRSARLQATVR
ncbi:uncharacterized protein B0H64DRAFT_403672 [Chaetomium fimeti]|uniref:Uncharacterized protein n=1 Tax=Chaetomium fimeti TaxID=1854472 RepID=A0AAE0HBB2_9PEZI|nr:hypothetical protein B0H64DRAFT_403672 [Chaetomium fimeti]